LEVAQTKLVFKLVGLDLGWPLLTGGQCSEVVVSTGLAVTQVEHATLPQFVTSKTQLERVRGLTRRIFSEFFFFFVNSVRFVFV
jgi:hypothetical protein